MTAKEVMAIIRACKRNGVKEFKLGELALAFSEKLEETSRDSNQATTGWNKNLKQTEESKEHQMEFEELQGPEENLLLDDPESFEQNMFKEGK